MGKRPEFVDWVEEQLAPLGAIRVRAMFGGYGFYADELFFAVVDDDMLYFKADDANRQLYIEAGCQIFRYQMPDELMELSYYAPPEGALDDQDELLEWARLGVGAALRARAAKTRRKPARSLSPDRRPARRTRCD